VNNQRKSKREPRLRTAEKVPPPYPLGQFPKNFALNVGKEIIYLLATKPTPSLEGPEWEQIFAKAIGGDWRPSNIGLDDIIFGNCAWGAKTIKVSNPWTQTSVRLISGRNSPTYSYGSVIDPSAPPEPLGVDITNIWNARVDSIRSKHKYVRTVVLIKSNDLLKLTIFETETLRYDPNLFEWKWNQRGNLEGWKDRFHKFTWQLHGSQFTIIEQVPDLKLCIKLKSPGKINQDDLFKTIGFDDSWVEVIITEVN